MESKLFKSPEEEIAHLRAELSRREAALTAQEATPEQIASAGREVVRDYAVRPAHEVLAQENMPTFSIGVKPSVPEVIQEPKIHFLERMKTEGVKKTLALLEKENNPQLTDAVHDALVEELRAGILVPDLKEGTTHWEALHMSLFEISIARTQGDNAEKASLKDDIRVMMQFFAGMQGAGYGGRAAHYTFEIAVAEGSNDIVFYVAVPTVAAQLFEKHILSLIPRASIAFAPKDYSIFVANGVANNSVARSTMEEIQKRVKKGDNPKVAIKESTFSGAAIATFGSLFKSPEDEVKEKEKLQGIDRTADLKRYEDKLSSPTMSVELRIVTSAPALDGARAIARDIQSAFNQFNATDSNRIIWNELSGSAARDMVRDYSFREPQAKYALALSQEELALLAHFPQVGTAKT